MPNRGQIHIDRALTNMSVAYAQSADVFVADKIFPIVPVQKQSDRYFVYDKGDFFRDEAAERAPGTESAGGDYNIDNTPTYFCKKYAYHKDVTEEDRVNADEPINPDADATEFVTHKLLLKRETLWANNFFRQGVWGTELTGGTSENSTTTKKWSADDSNPMKILSEAKTHVKGTTGYDPNVLVLGPRVYAALKNHPKVLELIKYTQKGVVTLDILATLFDVDRVVVPNAIVNTAQKGKAESTNFVFGNSALLAYAPDKAGLKKASAGYIFAWTGMEGAGTIGNRITRFEMPMLGAGTERIEGEMAFDMKVVAADLGFFFNDII